MDQSRTHKHRRRAIPTGMFRVSTSKSIRVTEVALGPAGEPEADPTGGLDQEDEMNRYELELSNARLAELRNEAASNRLANQARRNRRLERPGRFATTRRFVSNLACTARSSWSRFLTALKPLAPGSVLTVRAATSPPSSGSAVAADLLLGDNHESR
jgi:hypothetical protein